MAAENSVNNGIPVESSKDGATLMDNGVNCLPDGTGVVLAASGDGDSAGLGSRIIRTYKRRKCGAVILEPKLAHLENLSCNQSQNEMEKEVGCIGLQRCSCKQVCHCKKSCNSLKNGSADYLLQRWRSSLQNMFQSLSADQVGISGIESYIRDAPFNDAQVHSPKVAKGEGDSPHGQCSAQHASLPKRSVTDVGKHPALASNGSVTELNAPTVTKQCQHALFRTIMSEKFVSLCKLLSENFHPFKFDKIMDFSILESRMKQRAYEKAPALFLSDVQQLWRKLHVIGIEIVSLSKSLSEMSCPELALLSEQRDELPLQACRECGEESDGRNCVACDSCEQLFHVSCIKPSVTKILYINWYCANCTALVTESYHENCVVCGRLNHSHGINEVGVSTNDESPNGDAESSDVTKKGIQMFKGSKRVRCKVCRSIIENGEWFRPCEHHACCHYYHMRCLTNKQLKSFCSRWLCPCCLCRVCLTDKDDDKIVMCDACDHAYHIYCMHPPQKSIPEGQWYCRKCDSGLQAIHKAKLVYNSLEAKKDRKAKKRKVLKCC